MKMECLTMTIIVTILYLYILCKIFSKEINETFSNTLKPRKIAFMFLVYDEVNHEKLWKKFFENVDPQKYNIYVHYKNNKPSEFFDKYKIKNIIPTAWGHKSLVLAHNILLREALKDTDNMHFILVSNSCVPFKKFDHVYNALDPNYSYYNMFVKNNWEPRAIIAQQYVPRDKIKKAHQWSILNRKHAQLLVENEKEYIDWFPQIPDEHAHITYLFSKDLDKELKITHGESEKATTFTNWSEDERILKNYEEISDKTIHQLYTSPCLFGRKFKKECNMEYLYKILG
jgi:hypothetical protein